MTRSCHIALFWKEKEKEQSCRVKYSRGKRVFTLLAIQSIAIVLINISRSWFLTFFDSTPTPIPTTIQKKKIGRNKNIFLCIQIDTRPFFFFFFFLLGQLNQKKKNIILISRPWASLIYWVLCWYRRFTWAFYNSFSKKKVRWDLLFSIYGIFDTWDSRKKIIISMFFYIQTKHSI